MLIEEVKKLEPFERFCYWMKERHRIFLLRKIGRPKPWTDDEVLQSNFFTNPFRENDKVTVWFRENIRESLSDDPRVLMATIIFRWFNLPETGEVLVRKGKDCSEYDDYGWLEDWKERKVVETLSKQREAGKKVFTGAFMINSPGGRPKLEAIAERVSKVWRDRKQLLSFFTIPGNWKGQHLTLEEAHKALTRYEGLGGFMAYEVVCDLRYTYLLENATDKDTWTHIGPGARRGLYWLEGREDEIESNSTGLPKLEGEEEKMSELLSRVREEVGNRPKIEMREIEHSLCEADKYNRVLFGTGRSKRKYDGI